MTPVAWVSSGTAPATVPCRVRLGQRLDAFGERLDRFRAVESADLDVVRTRLLRRKVRALTAFPSVESPRVAVRRRYHRYAVNAPAQHPPHRVEWELLFAVDLVRAGPKPAVVDR